MGRQSCVDHKNVSNRTTRNRRGRPHVAAISMPARPVAAGHLRQCRILGLPYALEKCRARQSMKNSVASSAPGYEVGTGNVLARQGLLLRVALGFVASSAVT